MKSKTLTIILLIILFFVFFLIYMKFYNEEKQAVNIVVPISTSTYVSASSTSPGVKIYETDCGSYSTGTVEVDSKKIFVDVSDDECKQTLGLSGRTSMNDDQGMIFVFNDLGNYAFWMKDMDFPLDIIWIDDNFNIVGIEKDLAASTYPESFGEEYFAKYVLEINAGYSDKNNLKVGDKIIFTENN